MTEVGQINTKYLASSLTAYTTYLRFFCRAESERRCDGAIYTGVSLGMGPLENSRPSFHPPTSLPCPAGIWVGKLAQSVCHQGPYVSIFSLTTHSLFQSSPVCAATESLSPISNDGANEKKKKKKKREREREREKDVAFWALRPPLDAKVALRHALATSWSVLEAATRGKTPKNPATAVSTTKAASTRVCCLL
jgi:hypothetical protein